MKKLIIPALLIILAVSCGSEKKNVRNDLVQANLNGKIRTIEKKIHSAAGKAVCPGADKSQCANAVYSYNEEGFLTGANEFDADNAIMDSAAYVYSSNGVLKEIGKYSENKLKKRELYSFINGLLSEVKKINDAGVTETIDKFQYNGSDVISGQTLNGSGDIISSFKNEYAGGQVAVQTQFDKDGKPVSVSKFTRNEHHDITEYHISNPALNSEYAVIVEYEYDNQGNWTKQTQRFKGEIVAIIMRNITYYNS